MESLVRRIPFLSKRSRYLYVFIDESGNYDFSPSGTIFWIITALITTDIRPAFVELYDLKHELIDQGIDIERFHASEDRQSVRDRVFPIIARLDPKRARVDSVVVEKRKTAPSLQRLSKFYPMMVESLLKYPFHPRGIDVKRYSKVLVFLDRATSTKAKREILKKAIKQGLKPYLGNIPHMICMHQSASHHYLQMVDYLSWAIYVKWERGEFRPHRTVKHLIRSEFPIFRHGYKNWY